MPADPMAPKVFPFSHIYLYLEAKRLDISFPDVFSKLGGQVCRFQLRQTGDKLTEILTAGDKMAQTKIYCKKYPIIL